MLLLLGLWAANKIITSCEEEGTLIVCRRAAGENSPLRGRWERMGWQWPTVLGQIGEVL